MTHYLPDPKVLENYARVLINFALNSGRGVKPGEVVRLVVPESARLLYLPLRNQVLLSGAHPLTAYSPDLTERDFYRLASPGQLKFFPAKYMRGLIDQIDHSVSIISEADKHELEGMPPEKIMQRQQAFKPAKDWRDAKELAGKLTWTLALFGTPAMAREARMSLPAYWRQIIQACFLDTPDPVARWRRVFAENNRLCRLLDKLPINKLHIVGRGIDLWASVGPNRRWLGGSGRNIPSFEVFISPDWRGTEGYIEFNQPLYRYGHLVTGIQLKFSGGRVVSSTAATNYPVLRQLLSVRNGDKIGEFSLTDKRLSPINRFMAETLYDENLSGSWGNTHIALGSAYRESYSGRIDKIASRTWEKMGFNDSAVHSDLISTTRRQVTAHLADGSQKIIYSAGRFLL